MTSEVVVMNRMGAALAADSAVTVDVENSSKIRNSALKVFSLSKYHPVGVMVYGNGSLLGVPWETIIKLFRASLHERSFDKLEQYGKKLVEFVEAKTDLFPMKVQQKYFLHALEVEYIRIEEAARKELLARVFDPERDSPMYIENEEFECAELAIQDHIAEWEHREDAEYFKDVHGAAFISNLSGEINDIIVRQFRAWHTDANLTKPLQDLAHLLISKDHFPAEVASGLVVAGFGDAEHFPVLQHIEIGGVYNSRLKVRPTTCEKVSESRLSIVRAFAYTNMVDSFLSGISPDVVDDLEDAASMIERMPVATIDELEGIDRKKIEEIRTKLEAASARQADRFTKGVLSESYRRYDGIRQTIGSLSIAELAQVAPPVA